MTIYKWYPADQYQNKDELWNWCYETFGPGNDESWWSLTSQYDKRPTMITDSGEFINPCPFLFSTTDPKKLFWFQLKWSE